MSNPYTVYGISDGLYETASQVLEEGRSAFEEIESQREINQLKVIKAFQDARFSETHFNFSSGYGYDDVGREKLEEIYSQVFGGESAYVRIQISSGTQAIAAALFGVLRPKDEIISVTGRPYNSLAATIGIDWKGGSEGSLSEFGIQYKQVDLLPDGEPDYYMIAEKISKKTKVVFIQKSKGYTSRRSLVGREVREISKIAKQIRKDIVVFVDNCYGEFVELTEPCENGADLCAGSLIKNPGGGLAPAGGYIVGKKELVEMAASRLTAPGLGSHIGPSLGFTRTLAQGLYFAPHITAECLKGAVFTAGLFEKAGFSADPSFLSPRSDIVQSICFTSRNQLLHFCKMIQASSPVDSFVTPEPWDMPGYDVPVIMAAGTFTQGSSAELSADGPMQSPYTAYMQGGLVFEQVKLASLMALKAVQKEA